MQFRGDSLGTVFKGVKTVTTFKELRHFTQITKLAYQQFQGSTFVEFVIPPAITSIEAQSLYGNRLDSIVIPATVTNLAQNCFGMNQSIRFATFLAVTPPTFGLSVFAYAPNNFVIYVPAESVDAYKSASNFTAYASRIYPIPAS